MKDRSTLIAFITALLLHIIVGSVLLMNVNFSILKTQPKNEVPIINATVINQKLFDDLAQRKSEKIQAEKKKVEEEKQRIQQEKKKAEDLRKKKETKRIEAEKADTLRKKKAAERIVAEKALAAKQLKAKQDAEKAKKVADEKLKKQQAENARKQAEEQRKKIEAQKAEAQRVEAQKVAAEKAAAEAKVKAQQEKERLRKAELDKQMDAQFEDTFSNAQSSRQLSEIARYTALIRDKIGRNWQTEPSMKGKSCTLAIRTTADGLVISVTRSSGDLKLCESAKRAALKANTLPIPKDPDIAAQFRDFDITVEPDL
ncbi:MAG: colicin import membrane protein [Psychromonas sp.]|jgi:colicin import membrane protein|uniref:cell envelope integrity protein TolA n=1 Tax=Psychromonas sp. TaxID=1884585 RepID=UPI0039E25D50